MFDREFGNDFPGFGSVGGAGFGRAGFGGHQFKAKRGQIEPIILEVLLDGNKHGYEIITIIEQRTDGIWKPSAGSVYPTLTMLEEKGFVTARETDGKKVYSLTEAGNEEAGKARRNNQSFWKRTEKHKGHNLKQKMQLMQIMQVIKAIGESGDEEKIQKLYKFITDSKETLEEILYSETGDDNE
jgi:DNA-binding PadR family transcriptional regulator